MKRLGLAAIIIIVLVLGVGSGVGGTLIYQASYQPNINAAFINPPQVGDNPITSYPVDAGIVANSYTFDYAPAQVGTYALVFDNGFSTSSKSISLTYSQLETCAIFASTGLGFNTTLVGFNITKTFVLSPGNSSTLYLDLSPCERLRGSFTISGGSGNDIHFSIKAQTCTQTVYFSFTLVNSGRSDGYATVRLFRSDGIWIWSELYHVAEGQQLPTTGYVFSDNCLWHSYHVAVALIQKA